MSRLVPLDYTYVLYDPSDSAAAPLALAALSPFFLLSAYTAVLLVNRPVSVANLLAGQLVNEVVNGVLKTWLKAARPGGLGQGFGMPSSHSQFVAYASGFMLVHLNTIHPRLTRTPPTKTAMATRYALTAGLVVWPLVTGYSRYHLDYHTAPQVMVGLVVGGVLGAGHAILTEWIPYTRPSSWLAGVRRAVVKVWTAWPIEGYGGWGAGGWQRPFDDKRRSQ